MDKIYSDIHKNSYLIKKVLLKERLELAKIDVLFRERNDLFKKLKSQYVNSSIMSGKLEYMKKVMSETMELQKLLEDKKRTMSLEFSKKEKIAKKISQYKM